MDVSAAKNAIISDIYRGAIDPGRWPVVLEHMAGLVGAKSATLLYRDNETKQAGVFHAFNHPPEVMREYIDYYSRFDPTFELAVQHAPIGHAIADHQMAASRTEFRALCGPEFNRFLEKHDNEYLCGAVLLKSDDQMSALSFQKSKCDGPWTDEQLSALTELTPHIQRALTIHKEFTRLRIKEEVMQAGIDKLYMGFILFDEFLQPVYSNPIAQRLLDHHDAISLHGDTLHAFYGDDTKAIRFGLQRAGGMNGSTDELADYATALGLRTPGNPPLPLLIIPVTHSTLVPMQRFRHAHVAMLFSDPARNQPIIPEALQSAYGLTSTEAHIAIAIANGMGVPEIAAMRGTMTNTVKSHLKSIYSKLDVNRQTELAKTILNGPFRVTF